MQVAQLRFLHLPGAYLFYVLIAPSLVDTSCLGHYDGWEAGNGTYPAIKSPASPQVHGYDQDRQPWHVTRLGRLHGALDHIDFENWISVQQMCNLLGVCSRVAALCTRRFQDANAVDHAAW
jgi:hypothetical protein